MVLLALIQLLHFALMFIVIIHMQVVFLQEAFVGTPPPRRQAPTLSGYVSYLHHAMNYLPTYVHFSLQHLPLGCSDDDSTTFQLLKVTVGNGKSRFSNVYFNVSLGV